MMASRSKSPLIILLLAAFAAAAVGPSLALKCYNAGPGGGFMSLDCTMAGITEDAACASYSFTCSDVDAACTSEEAAAGVTKPARICTTGEMCGQMQSAPMMYKDTQCCTTDECNLPPDMLENTEDDEEQTGSGTGSSGSDEKSEDTSSTAATTATARSLMLGAVIGCLVLMANVA